jgi:hypothetical protein
MQGQTPTFDRNDPVASRDALSRYFADTATRAGQSLQGLDGAGPSPIPGGDAAAAGLRGALERLRSAYTDARDQVDRVDPSDPVALGSRLPDILGNLRDASEHAGLNEQLRANQPLTEAVRRAPSCGVIASAAREPGQPNPGN